MNMKLVFNIVFFYLSFLITLPIVAKEQSPYSDIDTDLLYVPISSQLSELHAEALSGSILSLYMAHAAQNYGQLFNDTTLTKQPLKDRTVRLYVLHPSSESDTLYQIDIRIYSPSYVGRRYNRMIIIRPYDNVIRPCVLFTHGNNGNLNTWANYYLTGVTSMLQRGYAVAFYENYNNSFFTSNSTSDEVYKDWVHNNLADSTIAISSDHVLQRGHYLLYQYAYAAHAYLTHIAEEYKLDEETIFTAGHSAGGISSLQLTFARPERNFKHPVFEYCGTYDSRKYAEISNDRIPVKGVLSSAAGLQDHEVSGSYFGEYLDEGHRDKTVLMIHGALDPLAPVEYGPALWGNFVDTVKLMGPLRLHTKMNDLGIKNFAFINCIGGHGVYMYPKTPTDNSGVFRELLPFSYDHLNLADEDFFTDKPLQQIFLFHQQMNEIMGNVAAVFSRVYHQKNIEVPSAIYTWEPKEYTEWVDGMSELDWQCQPTDCGIHGARVEDFYLGEAVPVQQKRNHSIDLRLYPNPTQGRLQIQFDDEQPFHIIISDITGRIRNHQSYRGAYTQIDVSYLEKGLYFISVLDTGNRYIITKKIIVQK